MSRYGHRDGEKCCVVPGDVVVPMVIVTKPCDIQKLCRSVRNCPLNECEWTYDNRKGRVSLVRSAPPRVPCLRSGV